MGSCLFVIKAEVTVCDRRSAINASAIVCVGGFDGYGAAANGRLRSDIKFATAVEWAAVLDEIGSTLMHQASFRFQRHWPRKPFNNSSRHGTQQHLRDCIFIIRLHFKLDTESVPNTVIIPLMSDAHIRRKGRGYRLVGAPGGWLVQLMPGSVADRVMIF